jgi:hypothetical protein
VPEIKDDSEEEDDGFCDEVLETRKSLKKVPMEFTTAVNNLKNINLKAIE